MRHNTEMNYVHRGIGRLLEAAGSGVGATVQGVQGWPAARVCDDSRGPQAEATEHSAQFALGRRAR